MIAVVLKSKSARKTVFMATCHTTYPHFTKEYLRYSSVNSCTIVSEDYYKACKSSVLQVDEIEKDTDL